MSVMLSFPGHRLKFDMNYSSKVAINKHAYTRITNILLNLKIFKWLLDQFISVLVTYVLLLYVFVCDKELMFNLSLLVFLSPTNFLRKIELFINAQREAYINF